MNWLKELFLKITNFNGSITGILVLVTGFLEKALGCKADPAAELGSTCTASWVPAALLFYATVAFAALQLIGKIMRPGGVGKSLFGSTAVIVPVDKVGPGTVTRSQVDAPARSPSQ